MSIAKKKSTFSKASLTRAGWRVALSGLVHWAKTERKGKGSPVTMLRRPWK